VLRSKAEVWRARRRRGAEGFGSSGGGGSQDAKEGRPGTRTRGRNDTRSGDGAERWPMGYPLSKLVYPFDTENVPSFHLLS
jgi:hypothetical protein